MNKKVIVRQGDVLLIKIDELPKDCIDISPNDKNIILAHGEATGHMHKIVGNGVKLFSKGSRRFLHVDKNASAKLIHDEHTAYNLIPDSIYETRSDAGHGIVQQEYIPGSLRNVAD